MYHDHVAHNLPVFLFELFSVQAARNIRHLTCVVKNNGLKGVCMFAIDCMKANGTHLGTCIDKFYFGSCCQIKDVDALYNPEISDNSIDSSFSTLHVSNKINEKPFLPVTTLTSLSTLSPSNKISPRPSISYNNKTFELISTSKATQQPSTTEKYSVSFGAFSTTLGTITQRNISTTLNLKDEQEIKSTTENIKLSTYQSIQESGNPSTANTPPSTFRHTTTRPILNVTQKLKPKPANAIKKPVTTQFYNRTTSVHQTSSTEKTQITRKPIISLKPSKNATSTVIKATTRKPVAPTNVAVNRRTTISSRRNSTTSTTRKPASSTVPTSSASTTEEPLTTISFVETTKAPRPRPKPTSEIVKIEATTLSDEDAFTTTYSVETVDKTTSTATTSERPFVVNITSPKPLITTTSTIKSTLVTRRTTKRPSTTVTSTSKPTTEQASTKTTTTPQNTEESTKKPFITTQKIGEENLEIPTTTTVGLVTWTLANDAIDNSTKGIYMKDILSY